MKIKFRMTILINLIMVALALTACGSGTEDVVKEPDEIMSAPETYEDYMKLADTYLQTDDVLQALAVLDEGIEKFSTGEQGVETQGVDLISQRKEYILAGMVAVGTNSTMNRYDDVGNTLYERVRECDENGNELWNQTVYYNEEGGIRYLAEFQYDGNGKQTECKYIDYDSDGNITNCSHEAWVYDENGKRIEDIRYDESGNIKEKTKYEYEYNDNGKKIEKTETDYDKDGRRGRWVKIEYDTAGNETLWECHDKYGKRTTKKIYTRDERGKLIEYVEYDDGNIIEKEEYERNESGNLMRTFTYDGDGNITEKAEYERDDNGNRIKSVYLSYDDDGNITEKEEYTYDENDRMIKNIRYEGNETVSYWCEYEYDEKGREIKFTSYNTGGSLEYWISESKYDENGRRIYYSHATNDIITEKQEKEYDEDGNIIKEIQTFYDRDTGQEKSQTIEEYTYDDNGNRIGYVENHHDIEESYSFLWERKYDEDGRETNFYLYDNEKAVSYQSESGYDENGRMINYTGYDKNGNVFVKRDTEYDTSGKVIRKNEYDADGNLIRYFENAYDDFGSLTRQTMYENGILKSEKQTSYAYHYIGDIDAEAAEYMDNDMTPEEYNIKQREIFTRFLNGEEKVRYYRDDANVQDGKIVEETITDLLDFEHIRQYKRTPEYTFLDMTGDGIEELVIYYEDDPERLCVIQCSYGILKVIHDLDGRCDAFLVKYNGRTGICHDWRIQNGEDSNYYYFLDEEGIKEIFIDDCQRYDESSEDWKHFYGMSDSDSFEECDISKGEYYDIRSGMVEKVDIDWQKLEEPN